jgi:3-phosphoshikimate 1-carboxyvinyltransferase
MNVSVFPSHISGSIQAPASKSCMQRACAAALIKGGKTIIHNYGISNDDNAALDIIKKLGATFEISNGNLIISSNGVLPSDATINCGESGLSVRMFTSIAALSNLPLSITGTGSLLERPMNFFDDIFPQLNVKIKSNHGKLPFRIEGPLIPENIIIDGSLSSQFLTGLLFAYSTCNAKDVSITVSNLKSKPYVDLTLDILNKFGMKVPENRDYQSFYFNSDSLNIHADNIEFTVEGDWSGAAFLLVAGAIAGPIKVSGLTVFSSQADKEILTVLKECGCALEISTNDIYVGPGLLKPFNFDATECPDLFPPLVALATYCKGNSVIKGISRLTHKESNRAMTLKEEFEKLGVKIELNNDDMIIYGGGKINGAIVHSRHDHRIAMACAVAALNSESEIMILDADAINKSYPNFYDHLKLLNAKVRISN